MDTNTRVIVAAAALLTATLAQGAQAQQTPSYPAVLGSGENESVEYGPGGSSNIVGGGLATVVGTGENASIEYRGPVQAETPLYAYAIGSGEQTRIIYSTSPDRDVALAAAGVFPFSVEHPGSATDLPAALAGRRGITANSAHGG